MTLRRTVKKTEQIRCGSSYILYAFRVSAPFAWNRREPSPRSSANWRQTKITGNANRATEAFRLEAVDYLLKPLDPEQVGEAVRRLLAYLRPFEAGSSPSSGDYANGGPRPEIPPLFVIFKVAVMTLFALETKAGTEEKLAAYRQQMSIVMSGACSYGVESSFETCCRSHAPSLNWLVRKKITMTIDIRDIQIQWQFEVPRRGISI